MHFVCSYYIKITKSLLQVLYYLQVLVKSEFGCEEKIAEYRMLWLKLCKLTQDKGRSMGYTYGTQVEYWLLTFVLLIFTSWYHGEFQNFWNVESYDKFYYYYYYCFFCCCYCFFALCWCVLVYILLPEVTDRFVLFL